jgi:hypothetical protein
LVRKRIPCGCTTNPRQGPQKCVTTCGLLHDNSLWGAALNVTEAAVKHEGDAPVAACTTLAVDAAQTSATTDGRLPVPPFGGCRTIDGY